MRTRYQRLIVPLFEEVWILEEQTANLRRTRDLLLPRLMSGRVELSPIQEHVKAE